MHPSCRSLPEAQPTTTFVACEGYPRTGPAASMRPLRVSKTLASVTSSGSSGGHHELVPRTGLVGGLRLPASMRVLDLQSRFRCRACDARGNAVVCRLNG